jgi:hypothetical protein
MSRKLEKYYPYVLGVVAGTAFFVFNWQVPSLDVLSDSITIGSIFTGFLATAKSLAISVDSAALQTLRKTKYYNLLIDYFRSAIYSSLLVIIFSLIGYFLISPPQTKLPLWFSCFWAFCLTTSVGTFLRVTSILMNLIKAR